MMNHIEKILSSNFSDAKINTIKTIIQTPLIGHDKKIIQNYILGSDYTGIPGISILIHPKVENLQESIKWYLMEQYKNEINEIVAQHLPLGIFYQIKYLIYYNEKWIEVKKSILGDFKIGQPFIREDNNMKIKTSSQIKTLNIELFMEKLSKSLRITFNSEQQSIIKNLLHEFIPKQHFQDGELLTASSLNWIVDLLQEHDKIINQFRTDSKNENRNGFTPTKI